MKPRLSAIVAVAENNAIGRDNDLLWHIPEDFKYFKRTTMGKPMLMGRKTFESLPGMLPGRAHVVVSRSADEQETLENLYWCTSLKDGMEKAYALAEKSGADEVFIIGGAEVYGQTLEMLDRLYLTRVHQNYEDADAFFPAIDKGQWHVISEERHEGKNVSGEPAFSFMVFEPI